MGQDFLLMPGAQSISRSPNHSELPKWGLADLATLIEPAVFEYVLAWKLV
jgi:hypothetical protein